MQKYRLLINLQEITQKKCFTKLRFCLVKIQTVEQIYFICLANILNIKLFKYHKSLLQREVTCFIGLCVLINIV